MNQKMTTVIKFPFGEMNGKSTPRLQLPRQSYLDNVHA
jgi:hypothetical protein